MEEISDERVATCDPETLWPLPEEIRNPAVIELFRRRAELFRERALERKVGQAQNEALSAISALAGLFPDPNDPAHVLLNALIGSIVDAKWGKRHHVLHSPSRPLPGTQSGFGHTYLAGFAIAATEMLIQYEHSTRQARIVVAGALADHDVSFSKDKDGLPALITTSAVRDWHKQPERFPVQHAIAHRMQWILTQNFINHNVGTKDEAAACVRALTKEVVEEARVY